MARNGRYLVAQAFATARGHQDESIAPINDVIHDGLLMTTEGSVAKDVLQDGKGGNRRHGRDCGI